MILSEILKDGRIRHYSDSNLKIRQIETGIIYEDAVDNQPCPYTYEETDSYIDDSELSFAELLSIIIGGEQ